MNTRLFVILVVLSCVISHARAIAKYYRTIYYANGDKTCSGQPIYEVMTPTASPNNGVSTICFVPSGANYGVKNGYFTVASPSVSDFPLPTLADSFEVYVYSDSWAGSCPSTAPGGSYPIKRKSYAAGACLYGVLDNVKVSCRALTTYSNPNTPCQGSTLATQNYPNNNSLCYASNNEENGGHIVRAVSNCTRDDSIPVFNPNSTTVPTSGATTTAALAAVAALLLIVVLL